MSWLFSISGRYRDGVVGVRVERVWVKSWRVVDEELIRDFQVEIFVERVDEREDSWVMRDPKAVIELDRSEIL